MILSENRIELNLNLKFRFDYFDHAVCVSTDTMRCFGCGRTGHLPRVSSENEGTRMKHDTIDERVVQDEQSVAGSSEPVSVYQVPCEQTAESFQTMTEIMEDNDSTDRDQKRSNVSLPKEATEEFMDTQNSLRNCLSDIEIFIR